MATDESKPAISSKDLAELEAILRILRKNPRLCDRVVEKIKEIQVSSKENMFDLAKKHRKF